jgi:hypothetical protein
MVKRLVVALLIVGGLVSTLGLGVGAAENREVWIPGLASFIIPGLGQLLNDQMDKAIVHFLVDVAINVGGYYLTWMGPFGWYGAPVWGLAHLGWALYSGYDAYTVAKQRGFSIGLTEDGLTLAWHF